MRDVAKRFSFGNPWALDSTFRTNQWDLPLYATIVPNQDRKEVPIFYMLCSKDKKQWHVGIAIELALTSVFASIGKIRHSAIVINKHMKSLNSFNEVIDKNTHFWTIGSEGRVQVVGRILLCHFHVT